MRASFFTVAFMSATIVTHFLTAFRVPRLPYHLGAFPYRDYINTVLLSTTFSDFKIDYVKWKSTLKWIAELDITPFDFRSNVYGKIRKPKLQRDLQNTYDKLMSLCTESTKQLQSASMHSSHETAINPFWRLIILFQGCVMCPLPKKRAKWYSLVKVIASWLRRFQQGQVPEILAAAIPLPTLPPCELAEKANKWKYPPF